MEIILRQTIRKREEVTQPRLARIIEPAKQLGRMCGVVPLFGYIVKSDGAFFLKARFGGTARKAQIYIENH
jgi:hypothetical protein